MNIPSDIPRRLLHALLACALACSGASVLSQAAPQVSKGELLYATHCISCHTTQMHWRDDRKATDWDSLKAQVSRWQGNAGLAWSDGDIAEVTRHLNDTIYKYPQTGDRLSLTQGYP